MTERLGVHYVAEPRPRRYDPNEHLARRHLPGKHNQKDHGHGKGGTAVKERPSFDVTAAHRELVSGKAVAVAPENVEALMEQSADGPAYNMARLQVTGSGNENCFRRNTRDVPRSEMPQLSRKDGSLAAFHGRLAERGITTRRQSVDPRSLVATQNQLDGAKVSKLYADMRNEGWPAGASLFVSRDSAVLDGHHRWAAGSALAMRSDLKVNVVRVDTDIDTLLDIAHSVSAPRQSMGDRANLPSADEWIVTDTDDGVPEVLDLAPDARHLPGKHDQKTHGHDGGGHSEYVPGAWKVETVDHEARVKELAAEFELNTQGWLRERAEQVDGPDWSRKAAEEILGFGHEEGTGTVYRNGKHSVAFESTKVTTAQQKQFLADVDNLQTKAPVERINIRVEPSTKFGYGTGGETFTGSGDIRVSDWVFTSYDNQGRKWGSDQPGSAMPSSVMAKVKASTYVLHHEWGHSVDTQRAKGNDVVFRQARTAGGLSIYGTKNGAEAYAEAFAEWSLAPLGRKRNKAVQVYAKRYEWGERWPSL